MEEPYRRTIDELITRYLYEPELRDLYVEGPSDKLLFEWFLKQSGCEDVAVFEIDCVDIPSALVEELHLRSQKRDRVIALSIRFEQLLAEECQYLLCVADADFDFILGRKYNSRYLVYTDYTSADLYFCTEYALEKVLVLGVRRVPCPPRALFENLVALLQKVFCIRAANVTLDWNLEWKDFRDCCSIDNNLVIFDCEDLIAKYLSKNNMLASKDEFLQVYEQLMAVELQDLRHRIRGRDFLELTGWYIAKQVRKGGSKYRDPDVIRAMIFPAVDAKSLANEKLFCKLLDKYR